MIHMHQLMAYSHALSLWRSDIRDTNKIQSPESMQAIDTMIRDRDEGIGWTWESEYTRNGNYMWCGAFVGACYRVSGIHPDIARSAFASTMRLDKWAKYQRVTGGWSGQGVNVSTASSALLQGFEGYHKTRVLHSRLGALRRCVTLREDTDPNDLPRDSVRRGDILLVGKPKHMARRKSKWRTWGNHVAMAIGPADDRGYIPTIEGNAKGKAPDDKWREGVVLQWRPIGWRERDPNTYHVRRIIRPSILDFDSLLTYSS